MPQAPEIIIQHEDRTIRIAAPVAIDIAGAGEINTGANVGAGSGLFRDKTGVTLNFKSLTGTSPVTITPSADEVDISIPGVVTSTELPAIDNELALYNGTTGQIIKGGSGWANASGQMLAPSGSVGAPSYTFAGDVGTGIYRPSAGAVGIQVGGTESWRFAASGALEAQGGTRLISNLANPLVGTDAINLQTVQGLFDNFHEKPPALVATLPGDGNITLSGLQTIDTVTLVANDRVLLTDQTSPVENGLWLAQTGAWTRPTDFATGASAAAATVSIQGGGTNSDNTRFQCFNDIGSDVVDTDSLDFQQIGGLSQVIAGNGLTKSGNTLDVVSASGAIIVNANDIQLVGLVETGGPTTLTYAAIPDGFLFFRSGTTVVGLDPLTLGTGDFVGPASSVADNAATFADTTGKLGKDSGVGIRVGATGDSFSIGVNQAAPGATNNNNFLIGDNVVVDVGVDNVISIGDATGMSQGNNVVIGTGLGSVNNSFAVVIGHAAVASGGGDERTVVGAQASASQSNTTALGAQASCTSADSTAVGFGAVAAGARSVSLGTSSLSSGADTIALLGDSVVGANSIGIGLNANTSAAAANAIAIGRNARCLGVRSIAIGVNSDTFDTEAIAIGDGAQAAGFGAVAIGDLALAAGSSSVAIGDGATSPGSSAVGIKASANGTNAIAISSKAVISNNGIAIGNQADTGQATPGIGNISIGISSSAAAQSPGGALAIGTSSAAPAPGSIAIGQSADGASSAFDNSVTIGFESQAVKAQGAIFGRRSGSATQRLDLEITGKLRIDGNTVNNQSTDNRIDTVLLSGLSGATVAASALIPSGAVVTGVTTRVTTAITGATTYQVGDGVDPNRWGDSLSPLLGQFSDGSDWTDQSIENFPAATDVVLTAVGGNFTAGSVRVSVHYMLATAPNS